MNIDNGIEPKKAAGEESMHALARRLWPLNRSLTGNGVRETLAILQEHLPGLKIREIPTGTECYDWVVPGEWRVREAWIRDRSGRKIVDFADNNLHLVGYSVPIDKILSLDELDACLYTLPEQSNAIPYITSYYKERWGFCLTQVQRDALKPGLYHVYIDSDIFQGSLTYGELLIEGNTRREVLLSTYVCHPSMANNELSGPVVATWLAKWIERLPAKRYSYRIVFVPETIGSICYISRNLAALKNNVIAGFVLTCLGDERCYSYLPSRNGNTLADAVAKHVLSHVDESYKVYTFLDRGSDERQYCSPGVDLPVCSIMRSKYGEYPEYHTSLDDLDLVTEQGLQGGFEVMRLAIECLENNLYPSVNILCEPQLGKRGLYPTLSTKKSGRSVRNMMNFLAYSDGTRSLLDISDLLGVPMWNIYELVTQLSEEGLIALSEHGSV